MIRALAAACLLFASCAALGALERKDYDHARWEIERALRARDFERLENIHEKFLEPDAITLDGTWMIDAFRATFDRMFRQDPPAETEQLLTQWRRQAPSSVLRPIAEAFARQQRAWLAKGGVCHPQLSASSRKAFDDLIGRASQALLEGAATGERSPLFHVAAILIGGGQGRPASELDALLETSVRRFPSYVPVFAARMTFLLPGWGGDFDAVDRFVNASVDSTRATEGRALYALLYVQLARECSDLFDESQVAWPDMRGAFDDLLQRHPGDWNRNLYATFACRARDAQTTGRLLAQLGRAADLGIGSSGITTDGCRQMITERTTMRMQMWRSAASVSSRFASRIPP